MKDTRILPGRSKGGKTLENFPQERFRSREVWRKRQMTEWSNPLVLVKGNSGGAREKEIKEDGRERDQC